jgi:glycosyltransferase involved in cell wall biosynthesis
MPHISVMIPTYNRVHLVGRTIDSILNQEFTDWDLVVVDDASDDDTTKIVTEYCGQDPRLHLVANKRNLGLTRNWNRCLDLATGSLVQIMQSDDLIDADYLGLVSEAFTLRPEIGFVAASCRHIDVDGRIIHSGNARAPRLYHAGDEAVTALLTEGWPHVSSIVMRRQCYEKMGKFDEKIWHGPDGEMFTRIASRFSFYHFGDVHTSFRRHGSNMGVLEYLRADFLEIDMYKKRLAWSYLSPGGRCRLGIDDLERHITRDGCRSALIGAVVMTAYGRADLSRFYLKQAIKLDRLAWHCPRFWKALVLLLLPRFGRKLMRSRMRITNTDETTALKVGNVLRGL